MSFTLESLVIAILAVLPGFVSAAIRATLKPGQSPSAGEWVAGSIVASLVLNAMAFFLFIFLFRSIDIDRPIAQLQDQFSALSARTALEYLGFLYVLALAWGIASGLTGERFAPRVLAYRLRLTPISPTTTVFIDALDLLVGGRENRRRRGDPNQQMAWLRIQRDGKLIVGRLKKSSDSFAVNEPIELFLSPGFIFETGTIIERPGRAPEATYLRGLYLRLRPEDVAEILVAPASWSPVPQPAAPHAAKPRSWLCRLLGGTTRAPVGGDRHLTNR